MPEIILKNWSNSAFQKPIIDANREQNQSKMAYAGVSDSAPPTALSAPACPTHHPVIAFEHVLWMVSVAGFEISSSRGFTRIFASADVLALILKIELSHATSWKVSALFRGMSQQPAAQKARRFKILVDLNVESQNELYAPNKISIRVVNLATIPRWY
jgi:hypothetical protein